MNWVTRKKPTAPRPSQLQAEILERAEREQRQRSAPRVPRIPGGNGDFTLISELILFGVVAYALARWLA